MIEQVARAIYEADDPWHEAFPWPNPDGLGVAANYRRIAQAILPLIEAAVLAERERCAGVAVTALEDEAGRLLEISTDYVKAKSTGTIGGRNVSKDNADANAKNFWNRANALELVAPDAAKAIRSQP